MLMLDATNAQLLNISQFIDTLHDISRFHSLGYGNEQYFHSVNIWDSELVMQFGYRSHLKDQNIIWKIRLWLPGTPSGHF
jgi:hypothetical protein